MIYPTFNQAIDSVHEAFKTSSHIVHTEKWQGVDISQKPEMATHELLNYCLRVSMAGKTIQQLQEQIKPNLPWADDHFLERVGGEPINPGIQWAKWPWGNHADKFRDSNGQFNHNYMERYWPKKAGKIYKSNNIVKHIVDNSGIRYPYGDLNDVVNQLLHEPNTRQAYMPVFFPEDTGAVHGGRVPCSLGYHFIHRNGFLHINYYLRSCEVYRHFRDDIYLTVRLLMWVLDRLREKDETWKHVQPGIYSMYITSFHCFKNDMRLL